DENEDDVLDTLTLMDDLKDYNAFYVPLFFVPLEDCRLMHNKGTELDTLTRARWEFLTRCWEYNVRIWRDTFLGNRITSPTILKAVNNAAIPFAAKIAQTVYGLKGKDKMSNIIDKLSKA